MQIRNISSEYQTYEDKTSHPSWGSPIIASWNVLERFAYRSDSVTTRPENGRFFLPTYYKACDTSFVMPRRFVKWYANPAYNKDGRHPGDLWFVGPLWYGMTSEQYPAPAMSSWVYERLRGIINDRILAHEFDLGQALGEADETVKLFVSTAARFAKAYRALRKGNLRKFGQIFGLSTKGSASNWLEFQYGWLPLMSDVYGAIHTLSEGVKKPGKVVKATVLDTDFGPIRPYGHLKTIHVEGQFVRGVTSKVSFKVADPLAYDLNALGIANPVALAWELLPFSFVIDWFFHVGQFLLSLTLPIGLSFEWRYETDFMRNDWKATDLDPNWVGARPVQYYRSKAMRRTVYNTFPVPRPYFTLGLNRSQIVNGLALLTQALR